jgi:2,4-dienoyl-CoA reductase (NADPH2)
MRPGEAKLAHLFQPGRFGRFEVKNRIKYGACCVSNYNTRDGFITEREIARMRVIARTGCGIVTNQGAYPDPLGEGKAYFRQVAIFDDKFLPQFERIAEDIKAQGAMAIQQILHAGRYGGIDLGYCIQPSDVPQTLPHFRPPKVMTKEEIRDCIRQHADAAKRAIRAGFDGTEVTSFMGYLLANFNSRFTNQRSDEYGGSLENRGRFMRELIDGIKQATPEHPLVVRLNGAELGRQHRGRVLRADGPGGRRRRRHDQRHRRLAGGARVIDRPRHPARPLELPVRASEEDVPEYADHVRQSAARPAHGR